MKKSFIFLPVLFFSASSIAVNSFPALPVTHMRKKVTQCSGPYQITQAEFDKSSCYTIKKPGMHVVEHDLYCIEGTECAIEIRCSDVVLNFNNKGIEASQAQTAIRIMQGCSNITLQNGLIIGANEYGIVSENSTNITFENIKFRENVIGFGITNCKSVTIKNCSFLGQIDYAIMCIGLIDGEILDVDVQNTISTDACVKFENGKSIRVKRMNLCNNFAELLTPKRSMLSLKNIERSVFIDSNICNNSSTGNGPFGQFYGVYAINVTDSLFMRCTLHGNMISNGGAGFFLGGSCAGTSIEQCRVDEDHILAGTFAAYDVPLHQVKTVDCSERISCERSS